MTFLIINQEGRVNLTGNNNRTHISQTRPIKECLKLWVLLSNPNETDGRTSKVNYRVASLSLREMIVHLSYNKNKMNEFLLTFWVKKLIVCYTICLFYLLSWLIL